MKNKKLSVLIKISILSAMAFIIYFIEFPIPVFPQFLQLDFSDIPALLGAFAMGPMAGIAIELIKNALHLLRTQTVGIGELANFITGAAFAATSGAIYKHLKTRKNAFISLIIGTLVMAVIASAANYYIFLPLYEKYLFPISAIVKMASKVNSAVVDLNTLVVFSILPFNLFKGVVISIITFLVYKRVSPILHK